MEIQNPRFYKFGDFILDSRRRILTKNDGEISISSKNFDLLFFLIQNEGRVLSHDEILDNVWEGTFVEQSNLKKGISAIRHVLGETPESSLYIKTIPRKGYSFIASVQIFTDEKPNEAIHITATEIIIEEEIIEDVEPNHKIKGLPSAPQVSFWIHYKKYIFGLIAVLILGIAAFTFNNIFTKQG
ncbi:MAG: transcriptional regulator, partial [Acidobacteriota bacterium]